MSAENLANAKWETAKDSARHIQQQWYESLAEWTTFEQKDLPYLKMHIGFAIYGLPSDNNLDDTYNPDNDISELIHYEERQEEQIAKIYDKIYEHGKGFHSANSVCYGLVYNVILPTKNEVLQDELKNSKSENQRKNKNSKNGNKDSQENEEEEVEVKVAFSPVFKIKKRMQEKPDPRFRGAIVLKKKNFVPYEIWYIDIFGRLYKSWQDYIDNNTLPRCIMILPKHGVYQPDPSQVITVDNSVVWLETQESPSCKTLSQLRNVGNIGSSVASVAGLAIGVAAMFTPVAPVVAGIGLACAGTSGAWTFGSSVHNLVDRSRHEESIKPDNREAFSAWLGVMGSTLGLAAASSTLFITKAVEAGKQVGNVSKVMCNTAIGGNIVVNGVGVGFQGFCIYKKYNEENYVSKLDIAAFATHVLFFGNAVMNCKFAGDIVKSAQGRVIEDYRSTIRTKRLRKAFNRVKRIAGLNNSDVQAENAEVIQYINRRKQFAPNEQYSGPNFNNPIVAYKDGLIRIGNSVLIDPREVAIKLILAKIAGDIQVRNVRAAGEDDSDNAVLAQLKGMMNEFLRKNFPTSRASGPSDKTFTDGELNETLIDISKEKFAKEILTIILNIMSSLIHRSDALKYHIIDGVRFLISYAKSHLNRFASESEDEADSSLRTILKRIVAMLEPLMPALFRAFEMYINTRLG